METLAWGTSALDGSEITPTTVPLPIDCPEAERHANTNAQQTTLAIRDFIHYLLKQLKRPRFIAVHASSRGAAIVLTPD
jgi:hypothetical protein